MNKHLSAFLRALKDEHPQHDLAEKSGLSVGTVNALITGKREASREHIAALVVALAPDRQAQLALVVAHLRDELEASGLDPTRLLIRSTDGADPELLDYDPLCEVYFGVIRRALHAEHANEPKASRYFAAHLKNFSHLAMRYLAQQADARALAAAAPAPYGAKKE